MKRKYALLGIGAFAALAASLPASADIIDFEAFTGPSTAGGGVSASTITVPTSIGNVVFTGGAILTATTNAPADESSVLFTSDFLSGGQRTITISFPEAINNFFLNLYNGEPYTDTFTVADNMGNSNTVSLDSNINGGTSLISFPATGNTVTVSEVGTGSFDFFIDNIGFDQPTPGVPEPASWAMMISGFGLVGGTLRRTRGATLSAA